MVTSVKTLEALRAEDHGRRLSMGNSMYGTVRSDQTGVISVYVVWRYRFGGRIRQIPLGTWKGKEGESLKALRTLRNALAVEVKAGIDPIERKATERIRKDADQVEAQLNQLNRHVTLAEEQARLTVRGLLRIPAIVTGDSGRS